MTSNFPRWKGDSTTPFILHLCDDLRATGWKIDVLAPHAPGAAYNETFGQIQVNRFGYLWPPSLETVCYQGGALVNLRQRPSNYLKLPALVLAEFVATHRKLRNRSYDLLHSHWILPQGFVGSLTAPRFNVPHVLTVHGGDIFSLRGRMLSWFKARTLCRADAITANSRASLDAVRQIAPNLSKIRHIPMGASEATPDFEKAKEIRRQFINGEGPLLIFVGRVIEEKGVGDFIDSVRLLVPRYPGVTALVVGDGQDRKRLEAVASTLQLQDRVRFVGWIPANTVQDYLGAADIFVAPSRTSREGWKEAQGLSIIEAMLAGVPVVATRCGGIVDTVSDGVTGILVDEKAPVQLADAIDRLMRTPSLRQQLAGSARTMARQQFTRAVCANAFSDLYSELLSCRQGKQG